MEQQPNKRIHRRVVINPGQKGNLSPLPNSLSTPSGVTFIKLHGTSVSSPLISSPLLEEEEKSLKNIKLEDFPYNLPKNYVSLLFHLF